MSTTGPRHTDTNDLGDVTFVKSSYSGSQGCVAIGRLHHGVAVQDTKLSPATRSKQTQLYPIDTFAAFIQALKDDKLNPFHA